MLALGPKASLGEERIWVELLPSTCHLLGSASASQDMKGPDRSSGPTAPGSPIPNMELPAHGYRELLPFCP